MAKYLDQNGLLYFWGKIKALIPTKTSQITNDSGYITTSDIPEGAAASTTTPKMDGAAAVGSELAFARGDHVHPSDTAKVDKVAGKELSSNDLTDTLKSQYDAAYQHSQQSHAPATAEKNVIVGVQKNGVDLSVDAATRKVNVIIPTKTSDLTNDKGYITADEVPETYTLPDASAAVKGGVKIGGNIDVASGGVISVKDSSTAQKGVVQLSSTIEDNSTKAATPAAVKAVKDIAEAKQSPATTLAGYGIGDAYTKTEIDSKLTSAMTYKGTKANYSDLPAAGNTVGDVWNITNASAAVGVNAGDNVAWNGSGWDVLSGTVDLSAYMQKTDMAAITNAEIDTVVASDG